MEKIDQILDSLYDRVIETMEAKEQLLDLVAVINCAKCGTEEIGFGLHGELCKDCDHLMRMDAMEHCL